MALLFVFDKTFHLVAVHSAKPHTHLLQNCERISLISSKVRNELWGSGVEVGGWEERDDERKSGGAYAR